MLKFIWNVMITIVVIETMGKGKSSPPHTMCQAASPVLSSAEETQLLEFIFKEELEGVPCEWKYMSKNGLWHHLEGETISAYFWDLAFDRSMTSQLDRWPLDKLGWLHLDFEVRLTGGVLESFVLAFELFLFSLQLPFSTVITKYEDLSTYLGLLKASNQQKTKAEIAGYRWSFEEDHGSKTGNKGLVRYVDHLRKWLLQMTFVTHFSKLVLSLLPSDKTDKKQIKVVTYT